MIMMLFILNGLKHHNVNYVMLYLKKHHTQLNEQSVWITAISLESFVLLYVIRVISDVAHKYFTNFIFL